MQGRWNKIKCFSDVISGGIIIIVCIVLYTQTYKIKKFAMLSDSVGPRFFPRVVLVVLAFLAILLIIGGVVKGINTLKELKDSAEAEPVEEKAKFEGNVVQKFFHMVDENNSARTWIAICGMFVMVLLMPYIGFALSATLYLFVQFTLLAPPEKRWKKMWFHAILAVVFGIGSYLLFKYAIRINLPAGFLKNFI